MLQDEGGGGMRWREGEIVNPNGGIGEEERMRGKGKRRNRGGGRDKETIIRA